MFTNAPQTTKTTTSYLDRNISEFLHQTRRKRSNFQDTSESNFLHKKSKNS